MQQGKKKFGPISEVNSALPTRMRLEARYDGIKSLRLYSEFVTSLCHVKEIYLNFRKGV